MKASHKSLAQARLRFRRAAERLVDDSSLRSSLTDAEANRLLDWGIELVQKEAMQSAGIRDEDALPNLEEKVALVRRVMRLVNRLMGTHGESTSTESAGQMDQLLEGVSRLTGHETSAAQFRQSEVSGLHWPGLDRESAFELLMALIQPHRNTEQEEE